MAEDNAAGMLDKLSRELKKNIEKMALGGGDRPASVGMSGRSGMGGSGFVEGSAAMGSRKKESLSGEKIHKTPYIGVEKVNAGKDWWLRNSNTGGEEYFKSKPTSKDVSRFFAEEYPDYVVPNK